MRGEWTEEQPRIALARKHSKSQYVSSLDTILPSSLMKIECANEGWVEIIMTVDSGATESVMGPHHAPNVPTVDGLASTAGVLYEVANGMKIKNEGEKRMRMWTLDGKERTIVCQVCNVNKCLLSVARLNEAGQTVILDGNNSYIQDKATGERVKVDYKNKTYTIRAWVRPNDGTMTMKPPIATTTMGFQRQA